AQVPCHLGRLLQVLRQVARVGHGGQVEGRAGEAASAAVLYQGVEEAVCRAVRRLPTVADGTGGGRNGDEEVKRLVFQREVQVPSSVHLALDDLGVVLPRHLLEKNILW